MYLGKRYVTGFICSAIQKGGISDTEILAGAEVRIIFGFNASPITESIISLLPSWRGFLGGEEILLLIIYLQHTVPLFDLFSSTTYNECLKVKAHVIA